VKESAGILFYRYKPNLQVLIVHPSGNYNAHAPYSVCKGQLDRTEDVVTTAYREVQEELGIKFSDPITSLGYENYSLSRKRIYVFAAPWPYDFEPKPISWELDKAEFVTTDEAKRKLHPDQQIFIDRLLELLLKKVLPCES